MTPRRPASPKLDQALIKTVRHRLEHNERVRRTLPAGGRLNVDRQLPFLVVYRPPPTDDAGTRDFVRSEAAYLITPADRRLRARTRELGLAVIETLSSVFGGLLVLEVWAGPESLAQPDADGSPPPPGFRVITPRRFASSTTVATLVESLERVVLFKRPADVEVVVGGRVGARGMGPLVSASELDAHNFQVVGIEVRPVYRNPDSGEVYPFAKRHLARQVSRAMHQACFEFARKETAARPRHYQALGRSAFTKAAWRVDASLASISSEFDLLLYVTPTNAEAAYREFRRTRYQRPPTFLYRPRDFDPGELKRRLHAINIDRVEDPTLAFLFREKKGDLDLKLSMLLERERPRFLPLSMALFGQIDAGLLETAKGLLAGLSGRRDGQRVRKVPAESLIQRAKEEFENYRLAYPPFSSEVLVRDDLTSLMVSSGNLLVGRHMTFPSNRVEPLLQHEVGTHVVTHWNGRAQPFQLLSVGLANYDELQEGLAVFAEYLAGGLTATRMRTLAARVVVADLLVRGAEFTEAWRELRDTYGFHTRSAFLLAMRVFRGGGFVKDSVYLRGVKGVLDYLAEGGHLETLLVGKIATEHAPIVEELQRRRVLSPAPLRPAYLDDPDGQRRLDRARAGLTLVDLVDR